MENLLLITFDQLRGDWCNPYQNFIKLPNLRKIARKGTTYTRCYTSSPQCVPARLSWLFGAMPSEVGVTRNEKCSINQNSKTIFSELQKRDIYTEIIGKTHWINHKKGMHLSDTEYIIKKAGFERVNEVAGPRALRHTKCNLTDEWEREGVLDDYIKDMEKRYSKGRTKEAWEPRPSCLPNHLYPDIWIANKGVEAINNLPEDRKWFLWISFVGPHEPFDTPLCKKRQKLNSKMETRIPEKEWIKDLNDTIELKKNFLKWKSRITLEESREFRNDYANNILLLDDQIGKLSEALTRRVDSENTRVIVTSDHGEMLGDYGMLYKSTFLELTIRVPMIIRDGEKIVSKNKLDNDPIMSTKVIRQSIYELIDNKSINHRRRKAIINLGKKVLCKRQSKDRYVARWQNTLEDDHRK